MNADQVDKTALKQRVHTMLQCMESLRNVLRANSGLEIQCLGHFKLLFWLLTIPQLRERTLETISLVAVNPDCVADIAACKVLPYMLLVMNEKEQCKTKVVLEFINAQLEGRGGEGDNVRSKGQTCYVPNFRPKCQKILPPVGTFRPFLGILHLKVLVLKIWTGQAC